MVLQRLFGLLLIAYEEGGVHLSYFILHGGRMASA